MAKLNIVFMASEASPLAKTGGLADVAGALPQALQALGHKVTVIMPFYRRILLQNGIETKPLPQQVEVMIDGVHRCCPLHQASIRGLKFILVEQNDLFDRDALYGPPGGAYEDNLLRYVLFNRVALEAAADMRKVDIIHCHDWQTGLVPLLLKTQYQHHPAIAGAKTVFTIHNLAYQGVFPADGLSRFAIPSHHFHPDGFEFFGQINCMKAGILMADAVTTVSNTYAQEILTAEYGCQIEGFLAHHVDKLSGIVNGLDVENWDPETDPEITRHYSFGRLAGKRSCKQALQEACELQVQADAPLLATISRLADQKGLDLAIEVIPRWLARGYQVVVLGSGDPWLEQQLQTLADAHPEQMHFFRGFNESLARQIYAGSDMFIMPSRFEPCGLGQLMAMRYGSVPVVRATGGLKDTVTDYQLDAKQATGFHFTHADSESLDAAVETAVGVYRQESTWSRMVSRAMRRDSSWQASAQAYIELYNRLA